MGVMESNLPSLKHFVETRMKDLGLSQVQLAAKAGLTKSEINALLKGRVQLPGADKRRRLAKALGVSHLDLLVEAGEITREELGPEVGRIERDPDDPRDQLAERIRFAPIDEGNVITLNAILNSWTLTPKTKRLP